MSVIRAEALKEKKALEEAYEEGFDVFSTMGMAVVLLHIIFVEVNSRFQTGCQTRLSCYPHSSLLTLDAPRAMSLPKLQPSMFVLVKR